MFSSPKNIAITALSALGAAALIVLTGGAAAPVMVGAGIIGGGLQIAKGIKKQTLSSTDNVLYTSKANNDLPVPPQPLTA